MKFKIIVSTVSIALIALIVGTYIFINQRESLVLDGQVQIPVLQHPVQVYFDQLSIPYIEARSEKDLTIAQGYVTASQRLFQMDLLRRVAKGEMAAIFGSTCLPNDKLARILGFRRIAEAEYSLLEPDTKKWLKDYCQGVNAYISQAKLPLEFILLGYEPQPWQPEDTLAILKYLQYASDECWQLNILQDAVVEKAGMPIAKKMFGPTFKISSLPFANSHSTSEQSENITPQTFPESDKNSRKQQDIQRPAAEHIGLLGKDSFNTAQILSSLPKAAELSWGSNGWVVSKNLSQSKGGLLACDKDTLFSFPDLFFLSSLRAPFIHMAGITIPGIPGILIGRNDNFAWTAVALKNRSQELCLEKFSDKFPGKYQNDRGIFKAKEIQEEIGERFASNRLEKIVITKDGPLLTKEDTTGIALNWYGFNPANNTIDSILAINRAKNWTDFSTALEKYRSDLQTFLYADIKGGIGEYIAGYNNHAGQLVTDYKNDAISEEEKISHSADFLVANAAQSPFFSPLDSVICNTYSGNNWAAVRTKQVLGQNSASKTKLNLQDMITLQADSKAPLSELVTKIVATALAETKTIDQYSIDAANLLNNWDGQLKATSISASIYEAFLVYTTKKLLTPLIGQQLTTEYINRWPYWTKFTGQILNKQSADLLPVDHSSFAIFNLNCLSQSLKNLRLIFQAGPMPGHMQKFQWQKLHQLDFRENIARFIPETLVNLLSPLFPNKIGIGADQDCINNCNYQISDKSPFYMCNSGPSVRLLIDMADNDKFYHSLIFGQSAHLFSKDRIDRMQMESWRNMEFHAIAFSHKQLEKVVRHNLTLDNQLQ